MDWMECGMSSRLRPAWCLILIRLHKSWFLSSFPLNSNRMYILRRITGCYWKLIVNLFGISFGEGKSTWGRKKELEDGRINTCKCYFKVVALTSCGMLYLYGFLPHFWLILVTFALHSSPLAVLNAGARSFLKIVTKYWHPWDKNVA